MENTARLLRLLREVAQVRHDIVSSLKLELGDATEIDGVCDRSQTV